MRMHASDKYSHFFVILGDWEHEMSSTVPFPNSNHQGFPDPGDTVAEERLASAQVWKVEIDGYLVSGQPYNWEKLLTFGVTWSHLICAKIVCFSRNAFLLFALLIQSDANHSVKNDKLCSNWSIAINCPFSSVSTFIIPICPMPSWWLGWTTRSPMKDIHQVHDGSVRDRARRGHLPREHHPLCSWGFEFMNNCVNIKDTLTRMIVFVFSNARNNYLGWLL